MDVQTQVVFSQHERSAFDRRSLAVRERKRKVIVSQQQWMDAIQRRQSCERFTLGLVVLGIIVQTSVLHVSRQHGALGNSNY